MIKQFPTLEDRTNVHNLILGYAHNKHNLNQMMLSVAEIVEQYKVSKFPVFSYSVKVIHSAHFKVPIISIASAQMSERCPVCKSEESSYLRNEKENFDLDYDIISVACLSCGCVYLAKGINHRANTKTKAR